MLHEKKERYTVAKRIMVPELKEEEPSRVIICRYTTIILSWCSLSFFRIYHYAAARMHTEEALSFATLLYICETLLLSRECTQALLNR